MKSSSTKATSPEATSASSSAPAPAPVAAAPSSSPCSPCAQLLHEILSRPDSRPRTLLQNMMSTVTATSAATSAAATSATASVSTSTGNTDNTDNSIHTTSNNLSWKKTTDGVQVEIPAPPQFPTQRRWSRLRTFEEEQQQRIATSVTKQTATATNSNNNNNNNRNRPLFFERSSSRQQLQQQQQQDQDQDGLSHQSSSSSLSQPPLTEWLQMICKKCATTGPEGGARAFVMGPQPLSVVLCSNRLSTGLNKTEQLHEMEEILTHELMHVYDVRQLHLDLRDCENLAYSEVRAARAAECSDTYSFTVNSCVRHKAWQATQNLFPADQARQCLQKVFDRAIVDTRPFGKNWNSSRTASSTAARSAASSASSATANTAAAPTATAAKSQ